MSDVDIEDLEDFIKGLKNTIDSLEGQDPAEAKGFQAQLAKAISQLRMKKMDKIEPLPQFIGPNSKEKLKAFLIKKLKDLQSVLDSGDYNKHRKFKLVKSIADLRAEINNL